MSADANDSPNLSPAASHSGAQETCEIRIPEDERSRRSIISLSSHDSSTTIVRPQISQILAAAEGDPHACDPHFVAMFLDMRTDDESPLFASVESMPEVLQFMNAARQARRSSHLWWREHPEADEKPDFYEQAGKQWDALQEKQKNEIRRVVQGACLHLAENNGLYDEAAQDEGEEHGYDQEKAPILESPASAISSLIVTSSFPPSSCQPPDVSPWTFEATGRRSSASSDWTYASETLLENEEVAPGTATAMAVLRQIPSKGMNPLARRLKQQQKSPTCSREDDDDWVEVSEASLESVAESGAIKEEKEKTVTDDAGLFTANFEWTKLPPALRVVYDKQGHRQEVIDGSTFWKFICRCTVGPEKKPEPVQQPHRPQLTEGDLMRFMSEFMQGRKRLPSVSKPSEPETIEEVIADRMQTVRSAQTINDDGVSSDIYTASAESSSDEDGGYDQNNGLPLLGLPMLPAGLLQGQDPAMMLAALGLGGFGGGSTAPPSPEEARMQQLNEQIRELRQDPEKKHLADCWERLLENQQEEDEVLPTQYTPWGLRQKASDAYTAYRRRRHERKQAKKTAAQERAKRVAAEEEKQPLGAW